MAIFGGGLPFKGHPVQCYGDQRVLPDNIPQVSSGVQLQQPVAHGDAVERGALLVAKVRVRNPELLPAAVVQSDLRFVVDRLEREARVAPRLPKVHADTVVLSQMRTRWSKNRLPLYHIIGKSCRIVLKRANEIRHFRQIRAGCTNVT